MLRMGFWAAVAAVGMVSVVQASEISGSYLETRTCQVYTGPCFANAETALAGKEAVMAWKIKAGQQDGVDLAGLSVVLVMRGSDTLGFGGVNDPKELKSAVIVDENASVEQREALVRFVRTRAGRAGNEIVRVDAAPIAMSLDVGTLEGKLEAGKAVKLSTRKANDKDCICTNEVAYYPPLTQLQHFAAGVSIEAEYRGRGLGTTWSTPGARSAYMGVFNYE